MIRAVWGWLPGSPGSEKKLMQWDRKLTAHGNKLSDRLQKSQKNLSGFPPMPQPLLAPGADGVCAPSAPSPHSSTMGVLTPALGNANRGS